MEQLFNSVEVDTALGQRNMAMLEVLYATGIRVAECASIQLSDIDLDISVILIHGKGKKIDTYHSEALLTMLF